MTYMISAVLQLLANIFEEELEDEELVKEQRLVWPLCSWPMPFWGSQVASMLQNTKF